MSYHTFFAVFNVACFTMCSLCACTGNNFNDPGKSRQWPSRFGFGYPASQEKIAALDIDIRPDGKGLPPGSGNAIEGRKLYTVQCASCHGVTGAEGPFNRLVATDTAKTKSIGNYWPYATTVFDYIRRAMPFTSPGSLTDKEVYNVTAYLLFANKLIDSTQIIDAKNLPLIKMPAESLFVPDDRTGGNQIR